MGGKESSLRFVKRWSTDVPGLNGVRWAPHVIDDRVVVRSGGVITAVGANGRVQWSTEPVAGSHLGSHFIPVGRLTISDHGRRRDADSWHIAAVDGTGRLVWKQRIAGEISHSGLIVSDGETVVVLGLTADMQNVLEAFRVHDGEPLWQRRNEVGGDFLMPASDGVVIGFKRLWFEGEPISFLPVQGPARTLFPFGRKRATALRRADGRGLAVIEGPDEAAELLCWSISPESLVWRVAGLCGPLSVSGDLVVAVEQHGDDGVPVILSLHDGSRVWSGPLELRSQINRVQLLGDLLFVSGSLGLSVQNIKDASATGFVSGLFGPCAPLQDRFVMGLLGEDNPVIACFEIEAAG